MTELDDIHKLVGEFAKAKRNFAKIAIGNDGYPFAYGTLTLMLALAIRDQEPAMRAQTLTALQGYIDLTYTATAKIKAEEEAGA